MSLDVLIEELIAELASDLLDEYPRLSPDKASEIVESVVSRYKSRILRVLTGKRMSIEEFRRYSLYRFLKKEARRRAYYYLRKFKTSDLAGASGFIDSIISCMDKGDYECVRASAIELLKLHVSSSERIDYIDEFLGAVNKYTSGLLFSGKVLDIACGLNPLYPLLDPSRIRPELIIGIDKDRVVLGVIKALERIYDKLGIRIVLREADLLRYPDILRDYTGLDVALILKFLHYAERMRPGLGDRILSLVDAKYVVITEPTISLVKRRDISFREKRFIKSLIERSGMLENIVYSGIIGSEIVFIVEK